MNVDNAIEFVKMIMQKEVSINPEDVCSKLEIIINDKESLVNDGYLICANGMKIILISNRINNKNRKKFIIAHELGHYLMHPSAIVCCERISDDYSTVINSMKQEMQANEFASELLLPVKELKLYLGKKYIDSETIRNVAKRFDVSLTHAAIKSIKNSPSEQEILLCYKDGVLQWYQSSNSHIYYSNLPYRCPVSTTDESSHKVSGYWDDIYEGTVEQEILYSYEGEVLYLLRGNAWRYD